MGLQELRHPGFGAGLVVRGAAGQVPPEASLDLLNVDPSDGGLRPRAGIAHLQQSAKSGLPEYAGALVGLAGFTMMAKSWRLLVTRAGVRADVPGSPLNAAGLATAMDAELSVARVGTNANEHVFVANSVGAIRLTAPRTGVLPLAPTIDQPFYSLDGVVTANKLKSRLVAQTPFDGRLAAVAGDVPGVGVDDSAIAFTDPGDPLSFKTNQFVRLDPGDGEGITAIASWRELWFVFKASRFYVFTGSSSSGGVTTFHRRPVDAGVGPLGPQAVAVCPDGVYFIGRDGLYRTDGGPPIRVSDTIAPLFVGAADAGDFRYVVPAPGQVMSGFGGPYFNGVSRETLTYWNGRLLLNKRMGATALLHTQLVYDIVRGTWTRYDLPTLSMGVVGGVLHVAVETQASSAGDLHLGELRQTSVGDFAELAPLGFPLVVRKLLTCWRSAWLDFGTADVKTLFESKFGGRTGPVVVKVLRDGETVPGPGGLGQLLGNNSRPEIQQSIRHGLRAAAFSVRIEALLEFDETNWSIRSMAQHLAEVSYPATTHRD